MHILCIYYARARRFIDRRRYRSLVATMDLARALIAYAVRASAHHASVQTSAMQAFIHQSSPRGEVLSSTRRRNVLSRRRRQVISPTAAAIRQHRMFSLLITSEFLSA